MNLSRTLDRRTFVVDLGRGSLALAVLGIAGCAPAATGSAVAVEEPRRRAMASRRSASASPARRGVGLRRRQPERGRLRGAA